MSHTLSQAGTLATAPNAGAYAPAATGKPIGKLLTMIGDSITGYSGSMETQNPGWVHRLMVESLGKIKLAGEVFATGGWTLEQIEMDHVPSVLALNPAAGACIVFGGTNNTGASAGTNFNFEQSKATHARILSKLETGGIKPILVLIPPRTDSQLVRQNVAIWNTYIAALAVAKGYPVFDAHTPMTNSTGSYANAAYTLDGIHPSELGYDLIVKYNIANGFLGNFTDYRRPPLYNTNLVTNGTFTVDTNADGLADSWSVVPAGNTAQNAPSLIAPDGGDLLKGKWQQILLAPTITGWLQEGFGAPGASYAIGDTIEVTARVRTTGVLAAGATLGVGILFTGVSSAVEGIYGWKRDLDDGLFRMKTVVPAGTTGMYFRAYTSGSSTGPVTIQLGEVMVMNLNRTIY